MGIPGKPTEETGTPRVTPENHLQNTPQNKRKIPRNTTILEHCTKTEERWETSEYAVNRKSVKLQKCPECFFEFASAFEVLSGPPGSAKFCGVFGDVRGSLMSSRGFLGGVRWCERCSRSTWKTFPSQLRKDSGALYTGRATVGTFEYQSFRKC